MSNTVLYKPDSTIALFSVLVECLVGFDSDYSIESYDDATGERMIQIDAVWAFHPGDSYELFFQIAHQPNGWSNEAERDQRQIAWDSFYPDHSFTPTWMLPKFSVILAAIRVGGGVVRLEDDEIQRFKFIKISEQVQRVVEDDWVYLWSNKEPRNARD